MENGNTDVAAYNNPFWNTKMNDKGFMGFVDKLWILERRIYTIIVLCWIVTAIIIGVFGCTVYNARVCNDTCRMMKEESFRNRSRRK